MSVLTKLFVVLVTVLSVLLVALVVPFVANTENYKEQLTKEKERRVAVDQIAAIRQSDLSVVVDGIDDQIRSLKSENKDLIRQMNLLWSKLADAEARELAERARNDQIHADVSRMIAANEQHAEMNMALSSELTQRRNAMINLQTKMIELTDRGTELEGQLATADRQVRSFQEQMIEREEELQDLNDRVAKLPPDVRSQIYSGEVSEEFEPQPKLVGRIVNLNAIGDQTFAEIDIGQNDMVKENMKFLVHRENQFLANLVITELDAQYSAGRLTLVEGPVQVGDMVLTGGSTMVGPPQ